MVFGALYYKSMSHSKKEDKSHPKSEDKAASDMESVPLNK